MSGTNLEKNNKRPSLANIRNDTFIVYIMYAIGMFLHAIGFVVQVGISMGLINSIYYYGIGWYGTIAIILGVILVYIKRRKAEDTIYYSHLQYLLRTFWIALRIVIVIIVTVIILAEIHSKFLVTRDFIVKIAPFSFFSIVAILFLLYLWFVYRLIFGFRLILAEQAVAKSEFKTIK